MKVIYNGIISEDSEVSIGIDNRAFNYGDGIFETIIGHDASINFLNDHIERLSAGLNELQITTPNVLTNPNELTELIFQLRNENNISGLTRIKIVVWRKSGGLFTPETNEAEYLITTSATKSHHTPKENVLFYDKLRIAPSPLSRFKRISSLQYVMAGIFKKEMNADDVILSDMEENIAECLSSNIFWIKGNTVFTPSLNTGCLEGIMRKQVIKFLNEYEIPLKEGKFQKEDLLNADFVFTSNVTGLVSVEKIEDKKFLSESGIFESLRNQFMI